MKLGMSIAAAGLVVVLGGCTNANTPLPNVTDLKSETLLTTTASMAHTFVHDKKAVRIVCSQPSPDAAFDQTEEGDISISLISTSSDGGGETASTEEVELAGRTPTVLLTRELFYRACEFSHNYQLTKEEALALYHKTLDNVVANWAIEAGNTTVTVGDTVSNATTAGVTATSAQTLSDTTERTETEEQKNDITKSDETTDTITDDNSSTGSN